MLTDLFRKAKSRTIDYEGKTVLLYDEIAIPTSGVITFTFLGVQSEWRQGVWLGDMPSIRDLNLTVGDQSASSMRIWQDTAPQSLQIEFSAPHQSLYLYNIWDNGNGHSSSQLQGAGMHLELDGKKRIYRCNDGHPETTFSHLAFSIEIAETP